MLSQRCPKQCSCNYRTIECQRELPSFIPKNVTDVIVYEINLDKTLNFSDDGWLNVTKVSFNPGESVLNTKGNVSVELNSRMFERMKNLEYLQVACRCLSHINQDTFYGLDKLKKLDLSNNRLTRDSFINGIKGDTIVPNLEELVYSNTQLRDFDPLIIKEWFLNAVKKKPLKVLDLSRTKIRFPLERTFLKAFLQLEQLNISESGSAVANLFQALYENELVFPGFTNLKSLDLSFPSDLNQIVRPGETKLGLYLSPLLKEFYFQKFLTESLMILYGIHGIQIPFPGFKRNETLCATMNFSDSTSFYCILGEINVEKLILSENSISAFDSKTFKHVTKLRYLDLSKNILGHEFGQVDYIRSVIETLKKLEVLLISGNDIHTIPDNAFENAEMLQVLDLSHNELESVTFSTDKLTALQRLDLRHNWITVLDGLSLQRLNTLKLQLVNITPSENGTTKIDLEGNLFTCSCDNRHYFNWTLFYNVSSSCLLDGVRKDIDYTILSHSYYLGKETIVIVVYALLAVIELVPIVVLVRFILRERQDAKLRQRIKHELQQYNENRENKQKMPIFLSFCSEDDEIVMGEIAPKLEDGSTKAS